MRYGTDNFSISATFDLSLNDTIDRHRLNRIYNEPLSWDAAQCKPAKTSPMVKVMS